MRKLGSLIIIGLLLSTPFTVFVTDVAAAARAKGVIRDVDLSAGTVTLSTRAGNVTLKTDTRTEITRNGAVASIGDLQITDKAQAKYNSDSLLAQKIDATGGATVQFERVEGAVSAVDEQERSLTIAPLHEGGPVTLHVSSKTYLTLDGHEARLADLVRGFSAGAMYDPETMDAVRVQAESFVEVRGIVRDVGVGTLTIATGEGDRSVTLNVAAGTPISLNDRPATLEDLRRGFEVVASYVEASLQAVRISATSRGEVQGLIRAVDLDSATVTISPLVDGAPVQVHVTGSTVITVDGETAGLGRLQPGMPAKVVFNVGSFEALSIAARSDGGTECTLVGVAGSIARVDVDGAHLAVHPTEGVNDVTLNVTNRTEISLNGTAARLSDLRVGMRVEARFCRETSNATVIAAQSPTTTECTLVTTSGVIAGISTEGGVHLAITPGTGGSTVYLNVTDRTEISLNGQPARLSDLRVGMRVEARFCRETSNATVIAAQSPTTTECTLVTTSGVIAGISTEGGVHLAITPGTGGSTVYLNVTDRTEISLNGQPARLSDLRVGMRVEARFCRETSNATVIAAQSPTTTECTLVSTSGVIAGISTEGGVHLAITPGTGGSTVYLNVTDRTEISLNGQPARLSDLRVGMRVEARFCRETSNATVIAAQSPTTTECTLVTTSGVIAGISTEGGVHLAITPGTGGSTVYLNVTDRTEISLNGQPARLSDLRVGMRVEARFCRETSNATVIAAQSPTTTECTLVSTSGVIAGISTDGSHLAVTPGTGGSTVYLNVTDRTEISLNGQPARLSDLRVGMRVEARFCRETSNATVIAAATAAQ